MDIKNGRHLAVGEHSPQPGNIETMKLSLLLKRQTGRYQQTRHNRAPAPVKGANNKLCRALWLGKLRPTKNEKTSRNQITYLHGAVWIWRCLPKTRANSIIQGLTMDVGPREQSQCINSLHTGEIITPSVMPFFGKVVEFFFTKVYAKYCCIWLYFDLFW